MSRVISMEEKGGREEQDSTESFLDSEFEKAIIHHNHLPYLIY